MCITLKPEWLKSLYISYLITTNLYSNLSVLVLMSEESSDARCPEAGDVEPIPTSKT